MNALINYLLEANLGLFFFLLMYAAFLRNETDFKLKRAFMLFAVVASVGLPLLHFNTTTKVLPSLSDFVPPTWLPEVVINANGTPSTTESSTHFDTWLLVNSIYSIGVIASLSLFFVRLSKLLRTLLKATASKLDTFLIIESTENKSAFSFFQFIFIGQANQLSDHEKQQIIDHERVHVQQLHSIDILLMNVLSIFFWFNPLIKIYKKIFIQLHEFEADARAVENRDVNNYCSLLAKVALLSADFRLANHFSNSLTVKRIEMMRTIKSKIRGWKIAAILAILPVFFFVVSCQDQLMNDAQEITQNSTMALDLPDEVQHMLDKMKAASPTKKFVVLEVDENNVAKAASLKEKLAEIKPEDISSVNVMKNKVDKNGNIRSFMIVEYNEMTEKLAEGSKHEGDIFTVVEQSAEPVGGIESLSALIAKNMHYPEESRMAGKEGTVFVQFVVNQDGSLSDFSIIRGVDPHIDEEAIRVAKLSPNWNPGKQSGKAIRQRFVLPIKFSLHDQSWVSGSTLQIRPVENDFKIAFTVTEQGDTKIIVGKVNDENGAPMKGANVINVGTTSGTVTDADGNFKIVVPKNAGELMVSFVGYKPGTIQY